jgi:hypothetical protein
MWRILDLFANDAAAQEYVCRADFNIAVDSPFASIQYIPCIREQHTNLRPVRIALSKRPIPLKVHIMSFYLLSFRINNRCHPMLQSLLTRLQTITFSIDLAWSRSSTLRVHIASIIANTSMSKPMATEAPYVLAFHTGSRLTH